MKRKITFLSAALMLLAFLAVPLGMRGQTEVSWTASEQGYANAADVTDITIDDNIAGTFAKASGSNAPKYYTTGEAVRMYNGNTLTITPGSECEITEIAFTLSQSGGFTVSDGEYSVESLIGTWTGSSTEPIVFTNGSSQNRIQVITVTYTAGGTPAVTHTLTFSANPTDGGTVTVGNTTLAEGATTSISATANAGYVFGSWTVTGEGSSVNDAGDTFTMGTEDATLTANFTAVTTYTVTYHANVTGIDDIEVVYNAGNDVTVAENTFSNPGFAFSEWNTQADGDGDPYVAGDVIENIQADIDLYAQWEESSEATATLNIQSYASDHSWVNGTQYSSVTVDQVTFTASEGNNTGKYYTADNTWRYYQGESATITISVPNGYHLVSIKPTYNPYNGGALLNGSATIQSGSTVGVSGTSVTFSVGNSGSATNGQVRFTNIDVTYASDGGVTYPSISAENVSVEYNATSGNITYTINNPVDGGTLTAATTSEWLTLGTVGETVPFTCTANEAAIERTATVTLTYTYDSQTVTKDVTVTQAGNPNYMMTIAEVRAQGTGSVVTRGIVTSCSGVTAYIQDTTAAICVYGEELTVGDEIRVSGTLDDYNGLLEIKNPTVTVLSSGNTIEPQLMTVAEAVASTNQGWYIRFEEVTVTSISGQNTTVAQGDASIVVRGISGVTYQVNDVLSLNGNIGYYNGNQIANPQNVEVQAAPVEPSITVTPATVNLDAEQHYMNLLDLTYENIEVEGVDSFTVHYYNAEGEEIELVQGEAWLIAGVVLQDDVYQVLFAVVANYGEARTAYFKVSCGETYSNLVTVTQAAPVLDYAVLPFVWEGGERSAFEALNGTSTYGVGDYAATQGVYRMKLDSDGDYIMVKTDGQPGTVTIGVKMVGGSDTSTITIQGSADGETFTDIEELTISGAQNDTLTLETTNAFDANDRYVRMLFTKGSNVGVGPITIAKGTAPSINIAPANFDLEAVGDLNGMQVASGFVTYNNIDITQASDFHIQFYNAEGVEQDQPEWILGAAVSQIANSYQVACMVGQNTGAARSTYYKVYAFDADSNPVYSNLVTINQAAAELPSITVEPDTLTVDAGQHLVNYFSLAYENIVADSTQCFTVHYYNAEGQEIELVQGEAWMVAGVVKPNDIYQVVCTIIANEGEARTAYFKVSAQDANDNTVYSNLVTVNQDAYVVDYATLPFEFDGGRAAIANTVGLTQENLGSDYNNSPKLKFEKGNKDNDGLYSTLILKFNERPGTLTFDIKGNSFSGGTFTVQTSEDGVTYTDLDAYTELGDVETKTFGNLGENVRYIKWIYTQKVNGNVALGNINLAKYTEPEPSIIVTPATVSVDAGEHDGTLALTYENLTISDMDDFDIQYYDAEGEEADEPDWIEVLVAEQDPEIGEGYVVSYYMLENDGDARTAYFKVFAMGNEDFVYSNLVTVTQGAAPAMALYSYSINGVEGQTIEVEEGATITLDNGENLNDDFTFAGWTTDASDVSLRFTGEYTLSDEVTVFYAVYKREGTVSIINGNTENFPTAYGNDNTFNEYTLNGKQFKICQAYINNQEVLQFRAGGNTHGTGTLYNNESLGTINSIVLNYNSTDTKKNFTVYAGTNANPTDGVEIVPTFNDNVYTFDLSGDNYSYFVMTNGANAGYLNSITINATNCSAEYYTRVFLNETLDDDYTIAGPSIIPANNYLDTDGNALFNSNADNFLIEEGGQLIHTGTGVPQVTMQKIITGYSNYEGSADNGGCWYMITAPLKGDMGSSISPVTFGLITDDYGDQATVENSTYDLYKYSDDGGGLGGDGKEWRNYRQNSFDIEPLTGYLYANRNDMIVNFKGSVDYHNGDVLCSNHVAKYLLMGNPFPCKAYLTSVVSDDQEAPMAFYRMNQEGDDYIVADGAIEPLEGIFTENFGEFAFTRTAPQPNPSINVNVNNGTQVIDRAIVSFGHGNMLSKRMLNENNTKLYIPQGTKDYAVVNAQSEGEMPVSFKASKNGTYTLSINAENVEMNYLHLIDNMTGADVDLLATPSYSFEASTTDYASRFRLVFNANTVNENSNETFAFFNGSEWVISNMGEATLQVVDLMGRVLSTETVNGNATMNINQTPGVYMLRLVNGDSVKVQKVVVR